jgi:ribonuclease BN (tRNA processing enzyme)
MPVAGRGGISSALIVDERVFVIDCGRGSPSAFADAGLDFSRLEAVFLTHLHADHIGDLPGMLLYPWGVREGANRPLAPIRVYGPPRPEALPTGDVTFHRTTTIHPERPAPGTTDLVENILAGYAYHLNVMPLDAHMPDAGALVRAADIPVPAWTERITQVPVVVFDDGAIRVTAVAVPHGRAVPALAYRFDTAAGSVVFSGDTAVNEDLIALAGDADILVHQVADLAYLRARCRPGRARTDGGLANRCHAGRERRRASPSRRADSQPLPSSRTGRDLGRGMGGTRRARLRRHDHRRHRRPAQSTPAHDALSAGRRG